MNKKGFFITIEGIDGCGKSTQIDLLVKYLSEKFDIIKTKEPGGGGEVSSNIRSLILSSKDEMSNLTELLLVEASRSEHFTNIIIPSLEKGKVIVCDRCMDSSIAYQGYGRGMDVNIIKKLSDVATNNIMPDLTLFLDIDPEVGHERIKGKDFDRIENEGIEFQKKVREGFLSVAKDNPNRVKIIDSNNRSIEDIHKEITNIVDEKIGSRGH